MVDANADGRPSPGDIVVFEDTEIRNIDNPFESALVSGKCTILQNAETRTADDHYCVTNIAPQYGNVVFTGELSAMSVAGSTGCYSGISANLVGAMYNQQISTYALALDEPVPDPAACIPDQDSDSLPWQQKSGFRYVSYGVRGSNAKPGDKLMVNEEVFTPSGTQGRVKGECTYLPEVLRNHEFCTLTFEFPTGSISVIGQFKSMIITGATDCYQGLSGTVVGGQLRNGAEYTFNLDTELQTAASLCASPSRLDNRLNETGSDIFFDADLNQQPSPGDSFLFDNHSVVVPNFSDGLASGVCTLLGSRMHSFCTAVYNFEEGSIVTTGYFEYMSIVGGTGCYASLRGQFRGRDEGAQSFSYEVRVDN